MADDAAAPAEHRLHWLLDALNTEVRVRGQRFGVGERELVEHLREVSAALGRGDLGVRLAVHRLVRDVGRWLDERRKDAKERHAARAVSDGPPCEACPFAPVAGRFGWHAGLSRLIPPTPAWMLDELVRPSRWRRE